MIKNKFCKISWADPEEYVYAPPYPPIDTAHLPPYYDTPNLTMERHTVAAHSSRLPASRLPAIPRFHFCISTGTVHSADQSCTVQFNLKPGGGHFLTQVRFYAFAS